MLSPQAEMAKRNSVGSHDMPQHRNEFRPAYGTAQDSDDVSIMHVKSFNIAESLEGLCWNVSFEVDIIFVGQQLYGQRHHLCLLPPRLHHPPHLHLGLCQGDRYCLRYMFRIAVGFY